MRSSLVESINNKAVFDIEMVSIVDYKDYLKLQYQRIERKVLSDESIPILKQLENKEHLFRRLTEIFEKTFNAERENLVDRLLRDNQRLRERVDSATVDESESDFKQSTMKSHSARVIEESNLERARLLKKNQELLREIESQQKQESRLVQGLRKEVEQLRSRLSEEQRCNKDKMLSYEHLEQQHKVALGKLKEQLNASIGELSVLQKQKAKAKELQGSMRGEIELLKNKLARLEVENGNYLSELNDLQGQLNRSRSACVKKDNEIRYLQQVKEELQQQQQVLQRRAVDESSKVGQIKSVEGSQLRLAHERLEMEYRRMQEEHKRTKRQLEKSRRQALEYRSLYEETAANLSSNRTPARLQNQLSELKQKLGEADGSYRRQLETEVARVKQQHSEESAAQSRDHHRELDALRKKLELKLREKQIEYEQATKDLAHAAGVNKELAVSMEVLRKELEELRQNRKLGTLRENTDLGSAKKHASSIEAKLEEKRQECDQLRSQLGLLTEEHSKLVKRLRNMEMAQLSSESEQSEAAQQSRKQSLVRDLKEQLHSKTMLQCDYESKVDSLHLQAGYLKNYVKELTSKIEQQRAKIGQLEQSEEEARKNYFMLEIEHKKSVEQLVEKFSQQAEETKEFYLGQIRQRTRHEPVERKSEKKDTEQTELKALLESNNTLKRELEDRALLCKTLERQGQDLKEELQHSTDRQQKMRTEYESMLELAKVESRKSLSVLAEYETRSSQHRLKFAQFKREISQVVRGILLASAQQLTSLKESLKALRYQTTKELSEAALALQSKIAGYERQSGDTQLYRTKRELDELQYRHNEQLKELRMQWQQKLNQQTLNSLTALTEKQLRQREVQQKLQVTEKSLQETLHRARELQQKADSLEKIVAEHKQLNGKLERRSRELQEQLASGKQLERRQHLQLQRQSQRVRKLERECQERLELEQRKYSQDNYEMFRRYQQELQKVIQQTASSPNPGRINYGPWDTPQRVREPTQPDSNSKAVLDSIRQEILLQRSKLQAMERPPSHQKPTKSKK